MCYVTVCFPVVQTGEGAGGSRDAKVAVMRQLNVLRSCTQLKVITRVSQTVVDRYLHTPAALQNYQ